MDELYGFIDSIVFCESERGFTVARLKEPRKKETTCIVGIIPSLQPGETIRCKGAWKHHAEYGQQFEVTSFELEAPADLVGIQKYLESGMIKGIGSVYAERIVKQFGIQTLEVIEHSPKRLLEVAGIGGKRVDKIQKCWGEQKSIRKVMIFLRGHGISPSFAQKIFRAYGDHSIEKVQANPFSLAKEIFGIGFKTADGLAKGMGIPEESAVRIKAGIEHVLWELSNEGHTCYPEQELVEEAAAVLQVSVALIEKNLGELVRDGEVIQKKGFIWVKPLYLAEVGITRELDRLLRALCALRPVDGEKALVWVEGKLSLKLAPEQREAVVLSLGQKVQIITGGPGTGKSTITKAILVISEKLTGKILLAAPTGRAAKRMTEITHKKAYTIHSLLEMDFQSGGFKRNRNNPLECDLLIIDEASMVDTLLMNHLLKAIPEHARLILIGDVDQLPSVGPGTVLKDVLGSKKLSTVHLKQIFRQAQGSKIVTNAHRINQGEFPDLTPSPKSDFLFYDAEEPEAILKTLLELVQIKLCRSHRFHKFDDIQILSPMRRGIIGTENLNVVMQQALNPPTNPIMRFGRCFSVGDKVMQIRNNYQKVIFNGDVGKIVEIDFSEQVVKVAFDGTLVEYDFSELDELVLAYAVSIHKYQGSECPCVIIPIHTTHFKMLYRNLLYTGITRGKKLVVLVGSKKAIAIALRNEEARRRHTGLKDTLEQFL